MKRKKSFNNQKIYGWIFVLPWLIGLSVLYLYPLISSIIYSFTSYNGVKTGEPVKFVGINNYINLFQDTIFWMSIKNTLLYAVIAVPVGLIFGVFLAMILNVKTKLQSTYRIIAFVPTLVPVVAMAVIWQWLLNSQFGLINYLLYKVGVANPPAWFGSPFWAKPALAIIAQWAIGTTVLTYLAGLQDIPRVYYESAAIDGAGFFKQLRHITLPLLTPVIFFNTVMGIINAFNNFTLPFVITNGEGKPANSMMFYTMYLYKNAFAYFKMGTANAMAWMMFIVILAMTIGVFATSKKWVHYMGE